MNAWYEARAVVLLGEAGLGKSFELARWFERRRSAGQLVDLIDLRVESHDGLVERWCQRDIITQWLKGHGELELFLDGVDEFPSGIRSFTAVLNAFISAIDRSRVYFRLASRPGAWTQDLAKIVGQVESDIVVLSLLPLEEADAREAAEHLGVLDPERFLEFVRDRQAEPLASRPLTLQMLCTAFADGEQQLSSRAELFERYLTRLFRGHREHARERTLTAQQRIEVASRIAAATLFSGRPVIMGCDQDNPDNLTVELEDLVGGTVGDGPGRVEVITRTVLEETIETGPFMHLRDGTLLWSSRAYEEYLGARYLARRNPSRAVLDALLVNATDPERRIVPILRGAMGWLADIMPQAWRDLARREPRALLDAELALRSPDDRAFLIDEWLKWIEAGQYMDDVDDRSARLGFLTYDGISAQLDAWLDTDKHRPKVVRTAARLAGETMAFGCSHRLIALVEQFWSHDPERITARLAFGSLHRLMRAEQIPPKVYTQILDMCRRVVDFNETFDPDDNLLGYALDILWPAHLPTPELLPHLRAPHRNSHLGSYQIFIANRFPMEVEECHLATAIRWAAEQSRYGSNNTPRFYDASIALENLATRSIAHLNDPEILSVVCEVLCDAYQPFTCPDDLCAALVARASNSSFVRTALATSAGSKREPHAVSEKLMEKVGIALEMLLEGAWAGLAEATTAAESKLFADAVAAWTSWNEESLVARLLAHGPNYPELANALEEIRKLGDEPTAIVAEVQRRRAETRKLREPKAVVLDPPLEQQVQQAIDAAQNGGRDEFWALLHQLARQPTDRRYHMNWHVPIWDTHGWQSIDDEQRNRIVEAARAFLATNDPQTDLWLGKKQERRCDHAFMGISAVRLLHARGLVDALDDEVLARWAPALVDHEEHFRGDNTFGGLLTLLLERVPQAVAETWVAVFEGETAWLPLRAFHEGWCPPVCDAFVAALHRQTGPKRLGSLLVELLRKDVDVAHEFAANRLSWLTADEGTLERERGRQIAFALLRSGARGVAAALDHLEEYSADGRKVLLRLGQDVLMYENLAADWSVDVVGRFAELLAVHFPPPDDEPDEAHVIGPEESLRKQRDFCLNVLVERSEIEGWKAVDELARLERLFPNLPLISYYRVKAVERAGVATWSPPSVSKVLELIDYGAPTAYSAAALRRLEKFLLERYSHGEIPTFLRRLSHGNDLESELVGLSASRVQLTSSAVEVLKRSNRIDEELFLALLADREAFKTEVLEIAAMFEIDIYGCAIPK